MDSNGNVFELTEEQGKLLAKNVETGKQKEITKNTLNKMVELNNDLKRLV